MEKYVPRLKSKYISEIIPSMMKNFGLKNVMAVPKLVKVCINQGVGCVTEDKKYFDVIANELTNICGQKAVIRKSKKAISNFKIREGMNIGCMVTLRRDRMYEFLDRLINIVLPRVRDFNGISEKSFDKTGIYNFGIKEQIVFPEVNLDKICKIVGMNISIVTNTKKKEMALALLKAMGFPFKK